MIKRHSGDKYEVKTNVSVSENAVDTSQQQLLNNERLSASGRPKREAARKVKFTFSESEYEIEHLPSKKRPRLSENTITTNLKITPRNSTGSYKVAKSQTSATKAQYSVNFLINFFRV